MFANTIMRGNRVEVADEIGVRTRVNANVTAGARASGRLLIYLVERTAPQSGHFSAPKALDLAWARLGSRWVNPCFTAPDPACAVLLH